MQSLIPLAVALVLLVVVVPAVWGCWAPEGRPVLAFEHDSRPVEPVVPPVCASATVDAESYGVGA